MNSAHTTTGTFKACLFLIAILASNYGYTQVFTLEVKNTLNFNRDEVVGIGTKEFTGTQETFRIKKGGTDDFIPVQWIDYDNDGRMDEILFMAQVAADSSTKYEITFDHNNTAPVSKQLAYARFVPERSDDFAWENDKVAFRVYGPKGQEEAMRGVMGSTLSGGVDIWLKRVSYPIIDKWYAGHVQSPGYYHTDRGEGYDPYHVGNSRGTGGTGVWVKDSLQVSENFTGYKIIASGPIRTVFELEYAPYSDYQVKEIKRITLDAGSNFSKFEVGLMSGKKLSNYAVGISLHQNKGQVKIDKKKGWFCHWEAIDGSFVGEGMVIDPSVVKKAFSHVSSVPDQSNLLVITKPGGKLTYYAGFAWQKRGQVQSAKDWDAMLQRQALIIENPLQLHLKIYREYK